MGEVNEQIASGTQLRAADAEDFGRAERRLQRRRALKRFFSNPGLLFGSAVILALLFVSVVGPFLVQDPLAGDPYFRLLPPSAEHLFGTDAYGRDVFARTVVGARVSIIISTAVAILATAAGLVIGLYAAYYRAADVILMRIIDALLAFPPILLAIAIVAGVGPTIATVILSLAIVFTPLVARVVRAAALSVKEELFVDALAAQQAGSARILWLNIFPNVLGPVIVQTTFIFAVSLIVEASLSFLGAGVQPPAPSWGNMLLEGKDLISQAWWMTIFPGAAIVLTVLAANLFGDSLRDFLDPQLRRVRKSRRRKAASAGKGE